MSESSMVMPEDLMLLTMITVIIAIAIMKNLMSESFMEILQDMRFHGMRFYGMIFYGTLK